ncbi:MAG TPA: hypothetical protein O0W91_03400 [Methanocorpusculum sp.]|nr:hypothetical protein [Methanocorpusculum sp.]
MSSIEKIVEERYVEVGTACGISAKTASRLAHAVIDEAKDVQGALPYYSESFRICIIDDDGEMGR